MSSATPKSCLSEAEMEDLAAGRLPPDRETLFKKHLDDCSSCQIRWTELREDEQIFKDLRDARQIPKDEPVTRTNVSPSRPSSTSAAGPEPAVVIEGYTITREIGRGGMGVVYEAIQQRLSRKVALKILPGIAAMRDHDAVNRFRREATAAARLHHTHIVPVYDFGQSGGAHYYAMELVEGRPLTEMIRRLAASNAVSATQERLDQILRNATDVETPGSSATFHKADSFAGSGSGIGSSSTARGRAYFRHVARWMADAADALSYAHDQGIIHRDIKPSNLLLARDGRIMILDFGLAKSQGDFSVTMTGAIVGTLRYMSPEQAMAKRMKVDHRTDIYSLGATMYELLAFQPAFAGHDDKETLGMIITRDPTSPRKISSAVPRELETICLKSLEKDPAARYPTARELADDLRRFINDLPISAKPPGPIGRAVKYMRRRRAATVAASATLLLILSIIAVFWTLRGLKRAHEEQVRGLLLEAANHINNQEYDSAVISAQKALELDSDNYGALVDLAIVERHYYERSDKNDVSHWDAGVRFVERAIAKNPNRVNAWNVKGVLMRLGGRLKEAAEAHQRCVEIDPTYYANWTSLANIYILQDDYRNAEDCLLKGTKWANENSGGLPWCNLAAVQLHLRKPEALASCEEGIIKNKAPNSASMLTYAKVLLTLPHHENPKKALEKAITASNLPGGDKNARVKLMQALAELRMGQFDSAIGHAEEAIAMKDCLPYSYLISSIACARSKKSEDARKNYERAAALFPDKSNGKVDFGGMIWIDSMDDLLALQTEAEQLLGITSTSKPSH